MYPWTVGDDRPIQEGALLFSIPKGHGGQVRIMLHLLLLASSWPSIPRSGPNLTCASPLPSAAASAATTAASSINAVIPAHQLFQRAQKGWPHVEPTLHLQ